MVATVLSAWWKTGTQSRLIELMYIHVFLPLTLFLQETTYISQNTGILLGKLGARWVLPSASSYGIKENDARHQAAPPRHRTLPLRAWPSPTTLLLTHPSWQQGRHFLRRLFSFLFVNDWHIEVKTPLALTRARCKKTSILIH